MDAYLGEIRLFGGKYAPTDWQFCQGQELPVSQYEALYSLIGNQYGGTAPDTFCLPDLRGRVPVSMGQGTGLASRTLGSAFGSERVTLQEANLPTHRHTLSVSTSTAPATPVDPTNLLPAGPSVTTAKAYAPAASPVAMAGQMITPAIGGGGSHENRMPFMAVNFIICTNGFYPTSS